TPSTAAGNRRLRDSGGTPDPARCFATNVPRSDGTPGVTADPRAAPRTRRVHHEETNADRPEGSRVSVALTHPCRAWITNEKLIPTGREPASVSGAGTSSRARSGSR